MTDSDAPTSPRFAAFLCGMFAFINLYSVQPMLPLFARLFDASESEVSGTISASTLGVACSAAMLAVLGERLDRKRTLVMALCLLSTCTLLGATATSLRTLALWRLLQGIVTPGVFVMAVSYVTEEWPASGVPRTMSIYVAGTVFGGFVGRFLGGTLAQRTSWRAVFVVLGVLGFAGAALIQRFLRPARPRAQAQAPSLAPIARNLRNGRLRATFGIGFCMMFTLVSTFSYVTFHLDAPPFSLSSEALSRLFSVYVVGLFVTLAIGTVLGRIGLRWGLLGAIVTCLVGLVVTLVPSLPLVGLGLAMVASGVFVAQTCCNSFLRDAAPTGSRVSATGMYICSYYLGGTTGGLLPAVAWRHGGWGSCVALTCSLLCVAALLTIFGWREQRRDPIPLEASTTPARAAHPRT